VRQFSGRSTSGKHWQLRNWMQARDVSLMLTGKLRRLRLRHGRQLAVCPNLSTGYPGDRVEKCHRQHDVLWTIIQQTPQVPTSLGTVWLILFWLILWRSSKTSTVKLAWRRGCGRQMWKVGWSRWQGRHLGERWRGLRTPKYYRYHFPWLRVKQWYCWKK